MGGRRPTISLHLSPSTPCTYMRGTEASSEMWAAQRNVCGKWVVSGAPKRMRVMPARGVPATVERRSERKAGY